MYQHERKASSSFTILAIIVCVFTLIACSNPVSEDRSAGSDGYSVGDTGPAGGVIIYAKSESSDGWQYLEASPSELSTNAVSWDGSAVDGSESIVVTGLSTDIGAGKENSDIMISALAAEGLTNNAAAKCAAFTAGGYSDWFLPSKGEMQAMVSYSSQLGLKTASTNYYWTSNNSSSAATLATSLRPYDGATQSYSKYLTRYVRPVRRF